MRGSSTGLVSVVSLRRYAREVGMRSVLMVLICGLLVGGCKSVAEDLAGSGPITLSPGVRNFINSAEWRRKNDKSFGFKPELFIAVREDGKTAASSYCTQFDSCGEPHVMPAIQNCEKKGANAGFI